MNTIFVNEKPIEVEVADTEFKRSLGLMYRKELPRSHGMLFIFPENKEKSFWMKDTHMPLSIAYIDQNGMITNIEDMEPLSLDSVNSSGPCKYALEVNKGWFEENNISIGDKIRGINV